MKKHILYLLRKPVDHIDPSLFLPSESQGDVVLLHDNGGTVLSYSGGEVYALNADTIHQQLSYDSLIKKIFESDRTIVI